MGWCEESNAIDAIEALRESFAAERNVKRNAEWLSMESGNVVPDDLAKFALGGLIHALKAARCSHILSEGVLEINPQMYFTTH